MSFWRARKQGFCEKPTHARTHGTFLNPAYSSHAREGIARALHISRAMLLPAEH